MRSANTPRAGLEPLEPRRLLSAAIVALSAKGTFYAIGTPRADVMLLSRDRGGSNYVLTVNGVSTTARASRVKAISLDGRAGADRITVSDARGAVAARIVDLFGQAGDDVLAAGSNPATLVGGDGDDKIQGGAGADVLEADAGNDTVSGSGGNDVFDGGAGDDTLVAGADRSTLSGADGNDVLQGGAGGDYLYGGEGDDLLAGGGGDDLLYGDGGANTLYGNAGDDTLAGAGQDRLLFLDQAKPTNGDPNDETQGLTGDDYFSYPAAVAPGNNVLDGGPGDDWLNCGSWSDDLHYDGVFDNPGHDTLTGGPGNDVLNARGSNSASPTDVITDQQPGDLVPVQTYHNATPADLNNPYPKHAHAVVDIFIAGRQVSIPAFAGDFGAPVIHVHPGETNIAHFHDVNPNVYTLEQFFWVWGVSFDATHVGRYTVGNGHTLTMKVKPRGQGTFQANADFEKYVIQSTDVNAGDLQDQIEIDYD